MHLLDLSQRFLGLLDVVCELEFVGLQLFVQIDEMQGPNLAQLVHDVPV